MGSELRIGTMDYALHVAVLILIYTIAAYGLNLVSGYAGMLSISHAVFLAIGAYAVGITTTSTQYGFWVGFALGIFVGVIFGSLMGLLSVRVRDDYFVLASLAVQTIAFGVINNWNSLTSGPLGLAGIKRPSILGITVRTEFMSLLLVGVISLFCFVIVRKVLYWAGNLSPYGRLLVAIRVDERFAEIMGKHVSYVKVTAFALCGALGATAGALYGGYVTFVDPTSFMLSESVLLLTIVLLGNPGTLWAPIKGAVLLVGIPELLRIVGLPGPAAAKLRQIVFGFCLVGVVMLRQRAKVKK